MTLKLRLYFKVVHLIVSFCVALTVAAIAFPIIDATQPFMVAKSRRERLKMQWFQWLATIFQVNITQVGEPVVGHGLLVCNHISWLDILVLNSLMPTNFVAKNEMSSWPIIGYLAKKGTTIFIRRGDKQQIKATAEEMAWQLKQQSMVIIFPEGTTTAGDKVLPFHSSLFQSALLTKSPIQVASLQYTGLAKQQAPFIGDDEFVAHLTRMLTLERIDVRVEFLATINTAGKARLAISDEARARIISSLPELQQNDVYALPDNLNYQ